MTRVRAAWLLPVTDDPVAGGWVRLSGGRIAEVGAGPAPDAVDLGQTVLLPSLVNAHTHLELCHLQGRVPAAEQFVDWIRVLMRIRRDYPDPADPVIVEAARHGIAASRRFGVGLVGDVSNTLVTVPLLRDAGMPAQVFYEQLGFNVSDPEARVREARARLDAAGAEGQGVRVSLAAHAPYSVSPDLFRAIRADLDANEGRVSSVHVGESPEEVELLRRGTGPWRQLLEDLGVWNSRWRAPGVSPVAYLSDLGFLDARILAVHGVQFEGEDLSRIAACGATIVSCPRSNLYVGVGAPPLEAFYAMDVSVAFGTDSLASAPDLDVFAELAAARRLAPRVPARRLLESATSIAARALCAERDFGAIPAGRRASLIAVSLPGGLADAEDVEEYLVSGVPASAVRWVEA